MDPAATFAQSLAYTAELAAQYSYVVSDDLAVRCYREATLTPRQYFPDRSYLGAAYDGQGALIRSTLRFNAMDIEPADPATLPDLDRIGARETRHERAIYGGILFPILGHFCFETLGRFWPLVDMARRGERPLPLCFHHWPGLDLPHFLANPFYARALARFGIRPDEVVIVDRPMSFGTLIIPDVASIYHKNLNVEMSPLFDFLGAPPDHTSTGRRIYLSRSRWLDNRRILNEEQIEECLARRGIEIVHTQDLGPDALMALLAETGTFISTDGSHAHLAAFCRPGTRSVMLDTRPVPTQFAIERLRGIASVHIPLYLGPFYTDLQVNEPERLASVVDLALAHLGSG